MIYLLIAAVFIALGYVYYCALGAGATTIKMAWVWAVNYRAYYYAWVGYHNYLTQRAQFNRAKRHPIRPRTWEQYATIKLKWRGGFYVENLVARLMAAR